MVSQYRDTGNVYTREESVLWRLSIYMHVVFVKAPLTYLL